MHEPNVKPIAGFPGYFVTSAGDMLSTRRGPVKRMRTAPNATGYGQATVVATGKKHNTSVHRHVADAFVPNPDGKKEVSHINGIKTDNRACNLEWCTRSESMLHAHRRGLCRTKLTPTLAVAVYSRATTGESLAAIASDYGVSRALVSNIKRGVRWAHATGHEKS